MSKVYDNSLVTSIARIAEQVLKHMCVYSDEAMDLVMRIGAVESLYQNIEQQSESSPAVGFFQVELATSNDIYENYLMFRKHSMLPLVEQITGYAFADEPWNRFQIMSNIALQVALCRLKYLRVPHPIPKSVNAQAEYWLKYYNGGGKGTVDKFIESSFHFIDT